MDELIINLGEDFRVNVPGQADEAVINFAEDIVVKVRQGHEVAVELTKQGPQGPQGPQGKTGEITPELIELRDEVRANKVAVEASTAAAAGSAVDASDAAAFASDQQAQAQVARTAAEAAATESSNLKAEVVQLHSETLSARTDTLSSMQQAEDAADTAGTYRDAALDAATQAAAANVAAETAKVASETARNEAQDVAVLVGADLEASNDARAGAEAAEAKAKEWADKDVDLEVEPSKFSAKHHAQKAADQRALADQVLIDTNTARADTFAARDVATAARNDAQAAEAGAVAAQEASELARDASQTARAEAQTAAAAAQTANNLAHDAAGAATEARDVTLATRDEVLVVQGQVDTAVEAAEGFAAAAEAAAASVTMPVDTIPEAFLRQNPAGTGLEYRTPAEVLADIGAQAILLAVTEAEATAGVGTEHRLWSAERVRLAINAGISDWVGSAPGVLDTLEEIAAALGDDPDFAANITALIGQKLDSSVVSPFMLTLLGDNDMAAARSTLGAQEALSVVSEVEAQNGVETVARNWTAERVRKAILAVTDGLTKASVGLSNVDNTADVDKPISTATQNALDAKAPASHVGSGGDAHSTATTGQAGFMSATDKAKLDGIAAGAQVNPTASAIKTAYESNSNTNAFTDAEKTKLSGIAAGATAVDASLLLPRSDRLGSGAIARNIAASIGNNATTTGALRIQLDQWTSAMLAFRVVVFNYATGTTQEWVIAGYLYTTGPQWWNVTAYSVGGPNARNLPVYFTIDGGKPVVYIGESNTVWSYPQAFITEFVAGYNGVNIVDLPVSIGFAPRAGTVQQTQAQTLQNGATTVSTAAPSGGVDGDVWYQVS